MNIRVRRDAVRGVSSLSWLDSRHTFSFGGYRDPSHMGFRALRVLNDDRVGPGGGFAKHAHENMEILTWVVDGALAHADSIGNGSTIAAGEAQLMSAGTGIAHSEFNHSTVAPVRFLQIWFLPAQAGLAPSYQQRRFDHEIDDRLRPIADPEGADGALVIHQDVRVSVARLGAGRTLVHEVAAGRHAWLQVIEGTVSVGDVALAEGDGAAVSDATRLTLASPTGGQVLLCDLA